MRGSHQRNLFEKITMDNIIIATSNAGKIQELQTLLAPIHCISQSSLNIDSPEETGLSFVENALIKARHASRIGKTAALADDSGLVVPALQGQPGIFSARFAGSTASDTENIHLLLNKMHSLPDALRQAYFYCAIAFLRHAEDPTPIIATGTLHGVITHEPHGHQGFGYDPIFYLPEKHCTMAELSHDEKNKISHRAQALQQFFILSAQDEN
jgi:XTP/dITP diphosphohydrolase